MRLIASTKMLEQLPVDIGFSTDTTIKSNDSDPSFYSTVQLSNAARPSPPARHSRLLLSLIFLGATVSFTEAYLLVKKQASTSQTQVAEISIIDSVENKTGQ